MITVGLTLTSARTGDVVPPSGTLTIADLSRDRIVFDSGAALGQASATIPLSGTGTEDAALEIRAVSLEDGGAATTPWTEAGTIGTEILEQVQEIDAVVVPVGGGGLIAGIALAVKTARPEIDIIGVEPNHAASFTAALEAGKPIRAEVVPTLADGLAVPCVGENAFAVGAPLIDRMIAVTEQEIALAILRLAEMEKAVVEGAGAVGVAAALAGKLDQYKGKRVASVLCGGNIDTTMLGRIMQRGMVVDGRICRFSANISDRPGGLADFTQVLASHGVSVIDITHDRIFGGDEIASVSVECEVETRNQAHILELRDRLNDAGFDTKFHDLAE
ncbi:MAG: pyridoxal-phosphate dependent enzyme [Pseudomonadota bacterium]